MAHDLFLGKTKHNFSRDLGSPLPMSDEVTLAFSPEEQAMLTEIATLRLKADAGDKAAKKQLVVMTKKVALIKARARKGDAKAKRALLVLRESGVFNETQTLTLGWSLFKTPDPAERAARLEKFTKSVASASKPEEIAQLSELATYDQAIKNKLGELARAGNPNAIRVAAYKKPSTAVVGGSDTRAAEIQQAIRKLRQKSPRTQAEEQVLEQLTERLTRIEAMSGIGYGPGRSRSSWGRNQNSGQNRRGRKINRLKAKAASGDTQATARLQQLQQRLAARAATGNPRAAALLQQVQAPLSATSPPVLPSTSLPYTPSAFPTATPSSTYPTATPSSAYPTATPSSAYPTATPSYQSPYQQPAYLPPYVPPYYQDADGNYYPTAPQPGQPQPGQPQPTIDVFVGHRSRRRAEEAAAEREDRGEMGWYGNSFVGGAAVCGNAIPHDNYRVAVMKAAVKSAGGGRPSTKDYFVAKSAVDKVIGKSGITIYMPGAKPGRRTI